jgi:hypothetical protein
MLAVGRHEVATCVVWACTVWLANMQQHKNKEGDREAAGRVTVAWVCRKLVGYTSTLVAGV